MTIPDAASIPPTKSSRISVSSTQEALNKYATKMAQHKKIFQVLYTIILVAAISIIWFGLTIPLIVGVLTRPSLTNMTRPYVEMLNETITTNKSILPPKCLPQQNESMLLSNLTITCPTNYVFNCTMCVPTCGLWHPFGESYFTAYRVTTILAGVIDLAFSLIGLLILLRVPGTFKVPQINYLFMFINAVIFSFFLAAAAIAGPYNFFCAQRNEDYSIVAHDPPLYLSFIGFVLHFAYLSFNLWFLCGTINVFIIVFWPQLRITASKRTQIKIFTIEAIISFGIPLIIPAVYLIAFKKYSFVRLPQIPFALDSIAVLVFVILPLLLVTAISLTIITITLYKLQMQKLVLLEGRHRIQLKSFEIRLILFAVCLGFAVFVVLLEASYEARLTRIFNFKLEEFWACLTIQKNLELFRVSIRICSSDYKAFSSPVFTIIGDIGLGIWTILLLIILTTKETRDAWNVIFRNICRNPFHRAVSRARTAVGSIRFRSHTNQTSSGGSGKEEKVVITQEL